MSLEKMEAKQPRKNKTYVRIISGLVAHVGIITSPARTNGKPF
jgi:hypothetical protein